LIVMLLLVMALEQAMDHDNGYQIFGVNSG